MRVPAIVASAAIFLVACGGSKKPAPDTTTMAPPPAAVAPSAGTGATHEIQMVTEGPNVFKFVPADITIKSGDVVVFKGVSGLTHDVAFINDSIPPGAAAILKTNIPNQSQDLATEMITDGNQVSISFAGAPAGTYKYYCIPHMAMNMRGSITVTP